MFKKVLIANRGEIALRIIRACRELGIRTLAVYSEADGDSLHVHLADEAICIGGPASAESYLRPDRILAAAEIGGVDAIHPGYGFLSESPHFAELCANCAITYIGPTANVIRSMGNKTQAKEWARRARVPVIPGSEGAVEEGGEGLRLAKKLGFPVLLKAAAGGGGRGMRLVLRAADFEKELALARTEAEKNFGIADVYVEKFVSEPHHIEFQVLADRHGNAVHLGERDCTIQRRYQKLLEESPSPFLTPPLRKKMGEAALRLLRECAYENAGTVEFLLDGRGDFYFMEMNTRIQVEHGVTEAVTGMDLVQWQLRIAAGERLAFSQKDVAISGHAIECRINAEDPARNFTPNPGEIDLYAAPGGPGIRIDSHAYGGYRIPSNYDSLIAKVIAHAPSRPEAIHKMDAALAEYVIRGVRTTLPYQRAILRSQAFRSGRFTTDFVEKVPLEALP
jgi:acetyl-CoA carboxylase biotin carboxylase subunit